MAKKSVSISICLLWLILPVPAASQSVMEARNILCDRTVFFYDRGHGNQIEYFSANGLAYLWYPGNRGAVPSQWRLEARSGTGETTICFKYPRRGYNPVTKKYGGNWVCRLFSVFWSHTNGEPTVGDIFGLSTGTVPYPLPNHPRVDPDNIISPELQREADPACMALTS